jgi:hypothetical protein
MHASRALTADRRKLAVIGALLVVQAALVFAIVFPGYKPTPHHVPIGFVGPSKVEAALATKAGGELSIRTYASARAARSAIDHRDIYGAFIAQPGEQQLLVASAASLSVSQLLRETASSSNATVQVKDVVPLTANDPRGATINLLFMPLIMVSFASVLALGALKLRPSRMIGAVALLALVGGAVVTTLISVAFGALPGSFLALSAVMTLTMLAIALPTAAFHRLFGPAGVGLGAVLFMFIANPASGNGTPPEMLPGFWRWISQLMPPGAGGTALRNVGYFGGNAMLRPLLVLSAFAVVGAGLTSVADAVRRRRSREVQPVQAPAADGHAPVRSGALQAA